MKLKLYLTLLVSLLALPIFAQEEEEPDNDSIVQSTGVISGGQYDSAIFADRNLPFKIYENRGDEMVHSWLTLGAPRAPHLYLGGGVYHFDKSGLSDIQFGVWPIQYPHAWESYFSAERMFFTKKTSEEQEAPFSLDMHGYNQKVVRYYHHTTIRRDKFKGWIVGAAYEGLLNFSGDPVKLRTDPQAQQGEEPLNYLLDQMHTVSFRIGYGRMRCSNLEYEAPLKRKGIFRASSMSRYSFGIIGLPIQVFSANFSSEEFDEFAGRASQFPVAGYFSWEARTALMHMKREWGVSANMTIVAPSWSRMTVFPVAFCATWGLYFSLDKKTPNWKRSAVK
jgi:hypothetical protein